MVDKAQLNSGKSFKYRKEIVPFFQTNGWRPLDIPGFDAVHPALVLHDLLEHKHYPPSEKSPNGGPGLMPEDEYQAVGALFYIRHEGGYFRLSGSRGTTADAIASSYGMLFDSPFRNKRQTAVPPATPDALMPLETIETETEMSRSLMLGWQFCQGRFSDAQQRREIQKSLALALPWMRLGYREAKIRFGDLCNERLSMMYNQSMQVMNSYLDSATPNDVLVITPYADEYRVEISMQRTIST